MDEVTEDTVLGGRVRLFQARDGYRVAIDPVLAAAAVPAKPGQSILDVGSGTGAAGFCLASRVPGIVLTGLERDSAALALARRGAQANGIEVDWVEGDVLSPPAPVLRQFDHVISNPPYRSTERGQRSPNAARAAAHAIGDADFSAWIAFCAARVAGKGTLTLVLPAAELARAVAVLESRLAAVTVLPLWPKQGAEARRVVLQARRGGKAPSRLLPGLVLHEADGGWTEAALRVLRDAAPL